MLAIHGSDTIVDVPLILEQFVSILPLFWETTVVIRLHRCTEYFFIIVYMQVLFNAQMETPNLPHSMFQPDFNPMEGLFSHRYSSPYLVTGGPLSLILIRRILRHCTMIILLCYMYLVSVIYSPSNIHHEVQL